MREAPHGAIVRRMSALVALTPATVPLMETTTEARSRAVALLKQYRRADAAKRTPLLRSLAETLVTVREHFAKPDGEPDWKGRTHAYRQWVSECYSDAGIVGEEVATVQAAVRYHVGIVLREHLSSETLSEIGLIERSPRERSHDRRAERSALVAAVTNKDVAGGALLALSAAYNLLKRLDAEELAGLAPREAEVAEETLADLERRVRALRRRVKS